MRDKKSISIILMYALMNGFIVFVSFNMKSETPTAAVVARAIAPEYTVIEQLNYFHTKSGVPQMSLSATNMRSQGEEVAEFENPKGLYNYQAKEKTVRYSGDFGTYNKIKELLTMRGHVKIMTEEAVYTADKLNYYFKKDLLIAKDNVHFEGEDPKSRDHVVITSDSMKARPQSKLSTFKGNVKGSMERKKTYEGKTTFSSAELDLDGNKSLAHLEGNVHMKRSSYDLTAGKGDIYLENYNKSLKYFVMNDDVKMSEKLQTPEGMQTRSAFAERLEGFGREQKMVLSGAPRVEMGKDVVKGYRITIRENTDLIEVDDAMSDVQVKRSERDNKKLKE